MRISKVVEALESGLAQVGTVAEKEFEDIPECNNCYQVAIGQILLRTADVAFGKKQSVAGNIIGAKGAVLARSLAFFMIDRACRFIPNVVASTANYHGPVKLLIIKEIALRHQPNLVNDFAFDHHRSPMGVRSWVRRIVLAMVVFTTAYS